jgi:hypothetical protein
VTHFLLFFSCGGFRGFWIFPVAMGLPISSTTA